MNFNIRPVVESDIPALARILVGAWQEGFKNILPRPYLDSMATAEWEGKWLGWLKEAQHLELIAETQEGTPAGFMACGKLKTPPSGMSHIRPLYTAEVYAVNVLPAYWRQGLGRRLMWEGAMGLKVFGHKSLCLWVMEKNERAIALYKALGGERCGKKDSRIGGADIREVCYGWRNVEKLWRLPL